MTEEEFAALPEDVRYGLVATEEAIENYFIKVIAPRMSFIARTLLTLNEIKNRPEYQRGA